MNLLILGGTGFLGPHTVREALKRGHKMTLFNRGRTRQDLFLKQENLRGNGAQVSSYHFSARVISAA